MRAKIELITSPTCPHCPHAKKACEEFVKGRDDVKLTILSTATDKGKRRAQSLGVRSVPSLFITGPGFEERIGYVGTPGQQQLQRMVSIALGKEEWAEDKGLFSRLAEKLKIKI